MSNLSLPIPQASATVFGAGIVHPDLFLWDAWSYKKDFGEVHLFCLAVPRCLPSGEPMDLDARNAYQFHIRHFMSLDNGLTWQDQGCFQKPIAGQEDNVWSGSVYLCNDGRVISGYTVIEKKSEQRPFVQKLAYGVSDTGKLVNPFSCQVLSCAESNYADIQNAGYYLADKDELGLATGESGGPILAWRDPVIFKDASDADNELSVLWVAKSSVTRPAIGYGKLECRGDELTLAHMYAPIHLPDEELYTQIECPKIVFDEQRGQYILIVATSDRVSEEQPIDEVNKHVRFYFSNSVSGPWQSCGKQSSALLNADNLYGLEVIGVDAEKQQLICVSPYTEAAEELRMTISKRFTIDVSQLGEVDQLSVNWSA